MVARQTSAPVKVPFDCCVDQSRPVAPLQLDVQVEAVGYGRDNRTVQRIAVHERILVRVEIAQPAPPRLGQVEPLDNRPQAIRRDREPEDRRIVDPVHPHLPALPSRHNRQPSQPSSNLTQAREIAHRYLRASAAGPWFTVSARSPRRTALAASTHPNG